MPRKALAAMKQAEPSFSGLGIPRGARGAYEMILMAFEKGDLAKVKPFLSDEVYDTFAEVVAAARRTGPDGQGRIHGHARAGLAGCRVRSGEPRKAK